MFRANECLFWNGKIFGFDLLHKQEISKTPLLLGSGTAPFSGFKIFAGTALKLVSAVITKVHSKTEFVMQGKEQRYLRMHS